MKKPGRLIVFEGPDGVGKSLLSTELVRALAKAGVKCSHFSFPGKVPGSLGALVYKVHHDSRAVGIDSLDAMSLQLLHLAAHVDAIANQILPRLAAGEWVVLDRYWWSMWVYGTVSGVMPSALEQMTQLELAAWGKCDATVFLVERKSSSGREAAKLVSGYKTLAERERQRIRVHRLTNDRSVEDVLEDVLALVLPTQRELPLGRRSTVPSLGPVKPTVVFDTYWRFAAERQEIFFRRMENPEGPWTSDPILGEFKFTNAYRASDRVSQYLIRDVIYAGEQNPVEVFFRTLLFKFFNRVETWETLKKNFGEITAKTFSVRHYDDVLSRAMGEGSRIYSPAYIMPSGGPASPWKRKHRMHLELLAKMLRDELPNRLADAKTMGSGFSLLRGYPTIGDFLAYQYITDLNYSDLFSYSEMEFTVAGPGARDGIRKCFSDLGGLTEPEVIRLVAERQQAEVSRLGISFRNLWGRPLQLIDCQNLFCEVDKYSRVAHPEISGRTGRTRIKQRFSPTQARIPYWYPPKWGINQYIEEEARHVQHV